MNFPPRQGLYDSNNEHDACGVGFVANIEGEKSHLTVKRNLRRLARRSGGKLGAGGGAP